MTPRRSDRPTTSGSDGEPFLQLPVETLRLDPDNPRLPEGVQGRPQDEILRYLYENGVLEELANSFIDNGYFQHEPLIVTRDGDWWTVLEGNRRFSAIAILLSLPAAVDAGIEFALSPPPTPNQLDALRVVPCYPVASPEAVHQFLGFRHIGGIKTWPAEAKARYLLREIERLRDSGATGNIFAQVGRRVGSNTQGVRNPYTALRILIHARDEFGIDTREVQQRRFGVWTRCMNSTELREYIGFGTARTLDDVERQLLELKPDQTAEVLGDLTIREGQRRAVLADSRDVTDYARVLMNKQAHTVMRRYGDLTLAKQIVDRAALAARLAGLCESVEVIMREVEVDGAPSDALDPAKKLERITKSLAAVIASFAGNDD